MSLDWEYFFSLFTVAAFYEACIVVIVLSALSWCLSTLFGFVIACGKLSEKNGYRYPPLSLFGFFVVCHY
ncbi:hypothetical protein [Psychromonas aquatilis]|uniref:Uncharacterized protein n=1 Tax=Psychromonas aquatilis TaxID=2005072 RepID=A0ABU9GPE5_9GAMM